MDAFSLLESEWKSWSNCENSRCRKDSESTHGSGDKSAEVNSLNSKSKRVISWSIDTCLTNDTNLGMHGVGRELKDDITIEISSVSLSLYSCLELHAWVHCVSQLPDLLALVCWVGSDNGNIINAWNSSISRWWARVILCCWSHIKSINISRWLVCWVPLDHQSSLCWVNHSESGDSSSLDSIKCNRWGGVWVGPSDKVTVFELFGKFCTCWTRNWSVVLHGSIVGWETF